MTSHKNRMDDNARIQLRLERGAAQRNKAEQLVALIENESQGVPGIPRELPPKIHAWAMDHLTTEDRDLRTAWNPAGANEGMGQIALRRYATFVHGIVHRGPHLVEFRPGMINLYTLPPNGLVTVGWPELQSMPESMAVFYRFTEANRTWQQYHRLGWVDMERYIRGWHRPLVPDVPAINGAAIRAIFSRWSKLLRSVDATAAAGSRQAWTKAIMHAVDDNRLREQINQFRDGPKAYDPVHPALRYLYTQVDELIADPNQSPRAKLGMFQQFVEESLGMLVKDVVAAPPTKSMLSAFIARNISERKRVKNAIEKD